MTTRKNIGFVIALAMLVIFAYLQAAMAEKRGGFTFAGKPNNNSNNKDKDDDDQNNDQHSRDRHRDNNDKKSGSTQVQQNFKGGQGSSDKSQSNRRDQKFGPQIQFGQQSQNAQRSQQSNGRFSWQTQSHRDHHEINNWVVKFDGSTPFSSKWYKDHPKAWHYSHHDDHDAWRFATAAGVLGWLGWQAGHPHGSVVIYEPMPYETFFAPGQVFDPNAGEWMPLGAYSLMIGPADASTRMLDLAVDRRGHIHGSYYDMISGATYHVAGIVDQRSQYAQWSLESNRQLTFFTPLGELLQPQSVVNVRMPSGQRQQWQLVRMEREN